MTIGMYKNREIANESRQLLPPVHHLPPTLTTLLTLSTMAGGKAVGDKKPASTAGKAPASKSELGLI